MFSLVAKFVILVSVIGAQSARIPTKELGVWNQIRPGIVTLFANGRPAGVAALVDDSGYFVAHSSSTIGVPIWGTTTNGKQLNFTIISRDRATMLVLLKTNAWEAGSVKPFHSPAVGGEQVGDLIAVLPNGPMRMTYGSKHKLGVLNPSRRLVPLTEMRFEAAPQFVGGALIFSESGELIGSLNATLGRQDELNKSPRGGQGATQFGGPPQVQNSTQGAATDVISNQNPLGNLQYNNTGPSDMTVAYTVSSDFVRHVLDGFLSPSHTVEFAIIGVFCTDALGGGAQIQQITVGSPADKAGMKPGDVIMNIASNAIADQVAFAGVMLQQKIGKKVAILVQRGGQRIIFDVFPTKAAD